MTATDSEMSMRHPGTQARSLLAAEKVCPDTVRILDIAYRLSLHVCSVGPAASADLPLNSSHPDLIAQLKPVEDEAQLCW